MGKTVYAVVRIDGDWRIASERRLIGRFKTQDDAMVVADRLVMEAIASGWDAKLSVMTLAADTWRRMAARAGRSDAETAATGAVAA